MLDPITGHRLSEHAQGLTKSIFRAMDSFERGYKGATPLSPDPAPSAQIYQRTDDAGRLLVGMGHMALDRGINR